MSDPEFIRLVYFVLAVWSVFAICSMVILSGYGISQYQKYRADKKNPNSDELFQAIDARKALKRLPAAELKSPDVTSRIEQLDILIAQIRAEPGQFMRLDAVADADLALRVVRKASAENEVVKAYRRRSYENQSS